jgi:tRNA modification GTPase
MRADTDTIVAQSSGFGRAGVAVIRISGPRTRFVIETMAAPMPPARRLSLRRLVQPGDGNVLDQALVAYCPGPRSFTGQDLAELHVHGGVAVVRAVLRALTSIDGVRLAEAGEFTRRAVLNGKLDLTSAEALGDLIDAETDGQRRQALRQLGGALARSVDAWRDMLLEALAQIEAELDFSDEGDVGSLSLSGLSEALISVKDAIRSALDDGRSGERMREGYLVVIAGPPNAGKSTLLNCLARRDAAIVSPVAGTTRDAIEIRCDIGGYPVTLVDTAGVRAARGAVEQQGVDRAQRYMAAADLVLWLDAIDSSTKRSAATKHQARAKRQLAVLTKSDLALLLGAGVPAPGPLRISALTGEGIDALLSAIRGELDAGIVNADTLITRERHRSALADTVDALERAIDGCPDVPLELLAEDVRQATYALGRITGRVGAEDVLDRLFQSFCIGK